MSDKRLFILNVHVSCIYNKLGFLFQSNSNTWPHIRAHSWTRIVMTGFFLGWLHSVILEMFETQGQFQLAVFSNVNWSSSFQCCCKCFALPISKYKLGAVGVLLFSTGRVLLLSKEILVASPWYIYNAFHIILDSHHKPIYNWWQLRNTSTVPQETVSRTQM